MNGIDHVLGVIKHEFNSSLHLTLPSPLSHGANVPRLRLSFRLLMSPGVAPPRRHDGAVVKVLTNQRAFDTCVGLDPNVVDQSNRVLR